MRMRSTSRRASSDLDSAGSRVDARNARLSPAHAAELAALRVVRVGAEQPPDVWRLEPDSRIGVLVGDGWELGIEPRLEPPKLFFLLAYSKNPRGWRDLIAGFERADDVVSALASGFAIHAERALHRGLLHGYVHVEGAAPESPRADPLRRPGRARPRPPATARGGVRRFCGRHSGEPVPPDGRRDTSSRSKGPPHKREPG